jgi:SAM-dependent methyltransferase
VFEDERGDPARGGRSGRRRERRQPLLEAHEPVGVHVGPVRRDLRDYSRVTDGNWFERLYVAAEDGEAQIPWDRDGANPRLIGWAERERPQGDGRRALVVGAGLGQDAEFVAGLGFDTVAFDFSPTAVDTARRRVPDSRVSYEVADLLDPPGRWREAFDLVVESLTVQSLPEDTHPTTIREVGRMVAPGGTLLVIATGREEGRAVDGPPWPLTRAEIESFAQGGLEIVRIEEVRDPDEPHILRWRAEFRRPDANVF